MTKETSIEKIRQRSQRTHDEIYEKEEMFNTSSRTFLRDTEPFALEAVEQHLAGMSNLRILDLGSGPGRIAIPIAQRIQEGGGRIVCVDMNKTAIKRLPWYAEQHGVRGSIEGILSSVEDFTIEPEAFDCIIIFGVLAHLLSKENIIQTLHNMKAGTKPGGINIIGLMTEPTSVDLASKTEQPSSSVEVYLTTQEGESLLRTQYADWEILAFEQNPYEETSDVNSMKGWKNTLLNLLAKKAS